MTVASAAGSSPPDAGPRVRGSVVWFMVATGPAVWMLHLGATAAIVPLQCREGTTWMVNALTAVCGAVILGSIVTANRIRRRALAAGTGTAAKTLAFVALAGQAWGTISLVVTVLEGLPNTVLRSCPP